MAEVVIRQLIDDLDGKPIDDGIGQQIFSLIKVLIVESAYGLPNADKIEAAFAPFIKATEKVSSAGKIRAKSKDSSAVSGPGRSSDN
ncbi:hypothetical protein ABH922_005709 [Rhodococcus sp. 27YEA15]|uniref:Lsr2 family protein n=1 Tax=Rhodococcus sp. 27YEA15 TaxID=3156259 RepID=UPI003C7B6CEA